MTVISKGPLRGLYDLLTGWIHTSWTGGLQAAFVVRSLNLRAAFRKYPPCDGARVLDAGCGEAACLASVLARRYPRAAFCAVDLFVGAQADRPANLTVLKHDLELPLPEGGFLAAYSLDLLEHVEKPGVVLANLYAALSPGGRLFIHVPFERQTGYFSAAAEGYVPSFREVRAGDVHLREGFSEEELAALLAEKGFRSVKTRRTFSPAAAFFKELYTLGERRRLPGVGLLLLPFMLFLGTLERLFPPSKGNGVWAEAVKPL